MLQTVRAVAAGYLEASEERAEVRQRYLRWAATTAADLEARLAGEWRDEFDAVADDLRAAVFDAPGRPEPISHQLARSLGHLTFARRFLAESLGHYQHAAQLAASPMERPGICAAPRIAHSTPSPVCRSSNSFWPPANRRRPQGTRTANRSLSPVRSRWRVGSRLRFPRTSRTITYANCSAARLLSVIQRILL